MRRSIQGLPEGTKGYAQLEKEKSKGRLVLPPIGVIEIRDDVLGCRRPELALGEREALARRIYKHLGGKDVRYNWWYACHTALNDQLDKNFEPIGAATRPRPRSKADNDRDLLALQYVLIGGGILLLYFSWVL